MFEPFPKLTRFSHDWTITEKVDGTNAQIFIASRASFGASEEWMNNNCLGTFGPDNISVFAGSRSRLLSLADDNHGFARFVHDNADELVAKLGEGRHFGEWYGSKIGQRKYGLDHKRFALFNATRWTGADLPERVDVVPILYQGYVGSNDIFEWQLNGLKLGGSRIAPGFMNPEGIVMFHGPSKTLFKKTFDYDEAGKWAENQERKAA